MLLHRIHLDPRCREARRDLADPYQLHSTLCRAFSTANKRCPNSAFLWRLEPETDQNGHPRVLVQSHVAPDWQGIGVHGWLASADPGIDLEQRLKINSIQAGQRYRFRLRANPSVSRGGRRLGLMRQVEQEAWLDRKGQRHGFSLPRLASFALSESEEERADVRISQEQMLRGKQHSGNAIQVFSVLYDGILKVVDPPKLQGSLESGIGHGKVMGLGLLSVAPLS